MNSGLRHFDAAESDIAGVGHSRQHMECRRHIVGAEEHPGDDDGEKGQDQPGDIGQRCEPRPDLRPVIVPGVVDAEIGAMQRAPDHKGPGRTVPEPAEQHGDRQIDITQQRAVAVAAERNVEIVAQELRQRHVPAPPEIDDRGRLVGRVEIQRQEDAEHQRYPDRHVGIAGEIEIELERIGQRADPGLIEGRRGRPEGDRDQRLDAVGEAGLLEQADRKDDQRRTGSDADRDAWSRRARTAGSCPCDAGWVRRSDAGNTSRTARNAAARSARHCPCRRRPGMRSG